jgi:hypothetical protein
MAIPTASAGVEWTSTSPAGETISKRDGQWTTPLIAVGVIIFGLALLAFWFAEVGPAGTTRTVLVGAGYALVITGAFALFGGYMSRRPALTAVGIGREGIFLRWASGQPTILRWDNPRFRFWISDLRNFQTRGLQASFLMISWRSGGLTTEAIDAILTGARAHGLEIETQVRSDPGGEIRRHTVGPKPGA